ncbi:MAG: hypothetical protein LRY32_05060, partial [Flavobacterium sp.]|nr:hypothetical protein [Flavobacterium sp.]
MRYFGILKEEEIAKLPEEDIIYYLAEKGIYDEDLIEIESLDEKELEQQFGNNPEIIEKIKFHNLELEINPSVKLLEEVNKFLSNKYRHKVVQKKIDILEQFEETVYGLEFQEEKKIGLELFNNLYSGLNFESNEKSFEFKLKDKKNIYIPTKLFKLHRFRLDYLMK